MLQEALKVLKNIYNNKPNLHAAKCIGLMAYAAKSSADYALAIKYCHDCMEQHRTVLQHADDHPVYAEFTSLLGDVYDCLEE